MAVLVSTFGMGATRQGLRNHADIWNCGPGCQGRRYLRLNPVINLQLADARELLADTHDGSFFVKAN